jgi:peptide/nickel transport system permease protein
LWRSYLFPAAANPLVSLAGLSLAGAIGSSLLVEVLLGWPGLGPMFLEAALTRDYPVVISVVMLLGTVLTISNLLADLVLYRLDPRIRLGDENRG